MMTNRALNDWGKGRCKIRGAGVLVAAMAQAAFAQEATIGLLTGYRFGGEFEERGSTRTVDLKEAPSQGVIVTVPAGPGKDYEFFFHRQDTRLTSSAAQGPTDTLDLTVDYWQAGGTAFLDRERVLPFVSGSLGLTHFNPDPNGSESETRFSMSLGGGISLPLSKHWSLRLDIRGFLTALNGGGSMFCGAGRCAVRVAGGGFVQADVGAGVSYRFGSTHP